MDAKHLAYSRMRLLTAVVAQYVITAVPEPEATLDEFARVLKPGRRTDPGQPHRRGERTAPHLRAGLRTVRAQARLAAGVSLGAYRATGRQEWCHAQTGVHLIERRPMPPLGHFSLIRIGKGAAASRLEPQEPLSLLVGITVEVDPDDKAQSQRRRSTVAFHSCGSIGRTLCSVGTVGAEPHGSQSLRPPGAVCSTTQSAAPENGNTAATTGSGENLSEQTRTHRRCALCPPDVDPAMKAPTPPVGKMPVSPSCPAAPGGDPSVQPK